MGLVLLMKMVPLLVYARIYSHVDSHVSCKENVKYCISKIASFVLLTLPAYYICHKQSQITLNLSLPWVSYEKLEARWY
jgi:hypothetical protein